MNQQRTSRIRRHHFEGIDYVIAEPEVSNSPVAEPGINASSDNRQAANSNEHSLETIVCLHGIGGDDASFEPQLVELSNVFRIISWNMPGYRQSNALTPLSFDTLANSLRVLTESLCPDGVHLMGQSIGGMVSQEFSLQWPDKVKSLILIATTSAFGGKDNEFKNDFLTARLAPLEKGMTMQELAEITVPAITGNLATSNAKDAAITSMSAVNAKIYRDVLKCLVTFNRRAEFSTIQCPICLISGSEDNNAPAKTMRKMAESHPHAEYHEIEGAGHLVNLETPDVVNRISHRFITRCVDNQ